MNNDFVSNWPPVLRWILVVPVAVGASLGIQLLFVLLSLWSESILSWLPDWALQSLNSVASGFALVYAAAWMAPRAKVVVAVTVAMAGSLLAGLIMMLGLFVPSHVGPTMIMIGGLLTVTGAGIAAWTVHRDVSPPSPAPLTYR